MSLRSNIQFGSLYLMFNLLYFTVQIHVFSTNTCDRNMKVVRIKIDSLCQP